MLGRLDNLSPVRRGAAPAFFINKLIVEFLGEYKGLLLQPSEQL